MPTNNFVVSAQGANNGGADSGALFLKLFGGEVLTAFERSTLMDDKQVLRTISNGKSAQFPVTGRTTAHYHQAGTPIDGVEQKQSERVISVSRPLVAPVFVDNWEEMVNHYDLRSIYTSNCGEALSHEYDQHIMINLIKAARADALLTELPDGTQIANDNFKIDGSGAADKNEQAAAFAAAIYQAAETMDDNRVPSEGRYCVLRPGPYYALVQAVQDSGFSVVHTDYNGAGSYSDGTVTKIAGITILKSPDVPSTDTSAAVGGGDNTDPNFYYGVDASKTVGLIWHSSAVGTVRLDGLKVEQESSVRYQGDLIVAKYAVGHGVLRPESAIELKLDTLSN